MRRTCRGVKYLSEGWWLAWARAWLRGVQRRIMRQRLEVADFLVAESGK